MPTSFLVLGSWQLKQYRVWVLSHGVCLKSSQRVVVYSDICATVVQHILQQVIIVDHWVYNKLVITFLLLYNAEYSPVP